MPCPEISSSFIRGRTLPHAELSPAHTPSLLDSHRSMASRERRAMPRKDGFKSMRSSSGSGAGGAGAEPAAGSGKEPRRCTGLSDARSRAQISCPGVFLQDKQDVYLGIYLLNQYRETDCFPSVFPIVMQQGMTFEKVFENAIDPGAVAELLESFLTRFELIQLVPPAWAELAYYEENTRDFLFPEPKLRPLHPGIHRELLMKTAIGFPGIAPKLEFSTRTAIRECVFPHRNRFLDEEYNPQKPSSNSYGQIPPLKNKKKKSKKNHDRLRKGMQSRAPSPYFTRRFLLEQPTQLDFGNHFRFPEDRKPPFVVRHVDSANPFGEDNLEHHLLTSQRKSKFSDFLFPMRRASSLDSFATNVKVIREPDERIVLKKDSQSSVESSKWDMFSLRNQGDVDFHRKTSLATSPYSRSSSPVDQPFQERFHCSSHSTWKKIHERVCSLLMSHRAQHHLKEDHMSEGTYDFERSSCPLDKCLVHEQRYF
ncbi:PREDICTED: spermatogenesis associated 6-like protein [Dipodomys ordii]|uniref:Spermatogenesis associated 6-like protein n=1 Tax=Dipodomys ordii TaxID=10020 RepID=A0A1S3FC80_DIPOR|nr:PREDICTED: spermatogenesis associated 6-like protein [Dipodomys ordii]